jgi:hypothetical protein
VTQLSLTDSGALFFEGYDTRTVVKGHFGSSDYDYNFTVPPAGVAKFYHLFNLPFGSRMLLLITLKDHFDLNEGYSKMSSYMTEHVISY